MASLKLNTIANFAGRGWTALLSLFFVPIYIKILGVESWGLIGFFSTLLAVLQLLDMGLSTTLNRELARLSAQPGNNREQRDLVRTLEMLYWLAALAASLLVQVVAPVIARYWINSEELSTETVTSSVRMMGLVFVFQFPFALYQGGVMGLQRHVLVNAILAGMGTLRSLGAVGILLWISPTVEAFFAWQLFISATQTILMGSSLWKILPTDTISPRFSRASLLSVWRFAAGMTGIALVTALLMNLDKILLSTMLPLKQFGYYMVGAKVSVTVTMLVSPFFMAGFPRLSQLVATDHPDEAKRLYHLLCQAVICTVLPVVVVIAFFAPQVISIWSRNPDLVENSSIFVRLLVIGTGLNALMNIPYAFQLANGWTKLAFYQNVGSVILLVPLLLVLIRFYGATGAASNWVILNTGYLIITPHIMHRRLLKTEKWTWYLYDVIIPGGGIVVVVSGARLLLNIDSYSLIWQFVSLAMTWLIALLTGIALATKVRERVCALVLSRINWRKCTS